METRNIQSIDIATIRHLPAMDFIGDDFAIFDNLEGMPALNYPTRLNATCLALCVKGSCRMHINLREYHLSRGMLAVMFPEQILQQMDRSDDFAGLYVVVSDKFVGDAVPTVQQFLPLFFMVKEHPCIHISDEEMEVFKGYHSFLWKKVKMTNCNFRKEIAQGLIYSLFFEIYNLYQGNAPVKKAIKSRKEDIFEQFIRAITESFKEERSVNFYADKMCLTSKHLSTAVKEVSGKTASEWVDDLVILEAKALLKSSEMSIQEISDDLHFSNQSFFGKYFKRFTGLSPKEYRRQ